jgi:hypothetical protein
VISLESDLRTAGRPLPCAFGGSAAADAFALAVGAALALGAALASASGAALACGAVAAAGSPPQAAIAPAPTIHASGAASTSHARVPGIERVFMRSAYGFVGPRSTEIRGSWRR